MQLHLRDENYYYTLLDYIISFSNLALRPPQLRFNILKEQLSCSTLLYIYNDIARCGRFSFDYCTYLFLNKELFIKINLYTLRNTLTKFQDLESRKFLKNCKTYICR